MPKKIVVTGYMNTLHGVPFIGLRLSNVLHTDSAQPANYEKIPGYWEDPRSHKAARMLGWEPEFSWRNVLGME